MICAVEPVDRVAHPQPEIGRHLVVAAARGVQPLAGLADPLGQPRLDVHVDVFERLVEREAPGLDFGAIASRPLRIACSSSALMTPDLRQHRGMRERAPDVLPPQLAVEADGGVDLLHHHRRAGGEAAAPLRVRAGVPCGRASRSRKGFQSMPLITRRRHAGGGRDPSRRPDRAQTAAAEDLADLRAEALELTDPPRAAAGSSSSSAPTAREHRLAEFVGHGMVVNLWATWCAPCVAEMPALAALSKRLAPQRHRGAAAVVRSRRRGSRCPALLSGARITGLPVLLDPRGAAARAWHAHGIPTSLIIDKGPERARLEGSADWSTPRGGSDGAQAGYGAVVTRRAPANPSPHVVASSRSNTSRAAARTRRHCRRCRSVADIADAALCFLHCVALNECTPLGLKRQFAAVS